MLAFLAVAFASVGPARADSGCYNGNNVEVDCLSGRPFAADVQKQPPGANPEAKDPKVYESQEKLRQALRQRLEDSTPTPETHMVRQACRAGNGAQVKGCWFTLQSGRCLQETMGTNGLTYTELPTDQCSEDLKKTYCESYPEENASFCPQPKTNLAKAEEPKNNAEGNEVGATRQGSYRILISEKRNP